MPGLVEAILPWLLDRPEVGWVVVMAYLAYELRGKRGRIYRLDKKITSAIIVIRAQARVEEKMDEEAVDEYLVENGMEPGDFIDQATPKETDARTLKETENDLLRSDGDGEFRVDEVLAEEEASKREERKQEDRDGQDFTQSDSQ